MVTIFGLAIFVFWGTKPPEAIVKTTKMAFQKSAGRGGQQIDLVCGIRLIFGGDRWGDPGQHGEALVSFKGHFQHDVG